MAWLLNSDNAYYYWAQPAFYYKVHDSYQDLDVAVNTNASKEEYSVTTKRSKKIKMQCDKGGIFKARWFGIRDTSTRKDEFPLCDNCYSSQWDKIMIFDSCGCYTQSPTTHPDAHSTHRNLARSEEVNEVIISQTRVGASSKQVIAAIRNGTTAGSPMDKPKDVRSWKTKVALL